MTFDRGKAKEGMELDVGSRNPTEFDGLCVFLFDSWEQTLLNKMLPDANLVNRVSANLQGEHNRTGLIAKSSRNSTNPEFGQNLDATMWNPLASAIPRTEVVQKLPSVAPHWMEWWRGESASIT